MNRHIHRTTQTLRARWVRTDIAGLITLLAVISFVLLSFRTGDPQLWLALAGLMLFTSVLYFLPSERGSHRRTDGRPLAEHMDTGRAPGTSIWSRPWVAHVRLAIMTATAVMLTILGADPFAMIVLFFVIGAAAPELLPGRQSFVWPMVCGTVTVVALMLITGDPTVAFFVGLGATGGYLFMASATESRMRADAANHQSQRLLAELTEAHRQLQIYATQIETLAVAEERNRLSREMHDTLGHRLTVAAVQLEGAHRLIGNDPERARTMVATVRQEIVDGLQELRRTVARLRTPLEADLRLPHALNKLADSFATATGITVHLDIAPDLPSLPSDHRQALFRAAQEALTNTQRHSGASNVWLQGRYSSGQTESICLRIEDDGCGINDTSLLRGYGLRGMRERAEALQGYMLLERQSQHGGVGMEICLPLNGEAAPAGGCGAQSPAGAVRITP